MNQTETKRSETVKLEPIDSATYRVRIDGNVAPFVIIGGNGNYLVRGRDKLLIGFKTRKSAVQQIVGEMVGHDYQQGKQVALTADRLNKSILTRLRTDPEFWQGFHDWRPYGQAQGCLEDPTRLGGWCYR